VTGRAVGSPVLGFFFSPSTHLQLPLGNLTPPKVKISTHSPPSHTDSLDRTNLSSLFARPFYFTLLELLFPVRGSHFRQNCGYASPFPLFRTLLRRFKDLSPPLFRPFPLEVSLPTPALCSRRRKCCVPSASRLRRRHSHHIMDSGTLHLWLISSFSAVFLPSSSARVLNPRSDLIRRLPPLRLLIDGLGESEYVIFLFSFR